MISHDVYVCLDGLGFMFVRNKELGEMRENR